MVRFARLHQLNLRKSNLLIVLSKLLAVAIELHFEVVKGHLVSLRSGLQNLTVSRVLLRELLEICPLEVALSSA